VALAALLLAAAARECIRIWRRHNGARCGHCGYFISNLSRCCPECGWVREPRRSLVSRYGRTCYTAILIVAIGVLGVIAIRHQPVHWLAFQLVQQLAATDPRDTGWRMALREQLDRDWWGTHDWWEPEAIQPARYVPRALTAGVKYGWLLKGRTRWPRNVPYRLVWGTEYELGFIDRTVIEVLDGANQLASFEIPSFYERSITWWDPSFVLNLDASRNNVLASVCAWDFGEWLSQTERAIGCVATGSPTYGCISLPWNVELVDSITDVMRPVDDIDLSQLVSIEVKRTEQQLLIHIMAPQRQLPASNADIAIGLRVRVICNGGEIATTEYWRRLHENGRDYIVIPPIDDSAMLPSVGNWELILTGDPVIAIREPHATRYWRGEVALSLSTAGSSASLGR